MSSVPVPDFCAAHGCKTAPVIARRSATDRGVVVWRLPSEAGSATRDSPLGVMVIGDRTGTASVVEEVARALPAEFYACACAPDSAAARRLLGVAMPSIALVELVLPDTCGISCAAELVAVQPALRFILVSTLNDERIVRCAFASGADCILVPPLEFRQCLGILRFVACGLRNQVPQLANDEEQVLRCFAEGLTSKEIAVRLGVSTAHLRKIETRIRKHLVARNRAESVSHWLLWRAGRAQSDLGDAARGAA